MTVSLHKKRIRGLLADERGQVGIIFGLSLIPVMVAVGVGIDYGRFNDAKSNLQTAVDATALALTKTLTVNSTSGSTALTTAATTSLQAYMGTNVALTAGPTLSNNNGQLCLSATTTVQATISGAIKALGTGGRDSSNTIHASACAEIASGGPYEIAMALDNTGSMGESTTTNGTTTTKIQAEKLAAKALIAQLNPTGGAASATFSIVPFTNNVNVGSEYAGASWLDTSGQSSIHWQNYTRPAGATWLPNSRFDMFTSTGTTWAGCVEERPDPYLTTDTASSSGTPDTLIVPYFWPDEADLNANSAVNGTAQLPGMTVGSGYSSQTYTASTYSSIINNGSQNNYLYDFGGICGSTATDKYEVADLADPISKGSGATKLCKYKALSGTISGVSSSVSSYGPNYACNANKLLPLTQDTSALTAKINSMVAGGTTNLLPGFMWAWRTISPNGPWSDPTTLANAPTGTAAPKSYSATNNTKVIVFMTDGFNNWTSNSYMYKSEYNAFGYYVNNRLSAYGGTTYPTPTGATTYSGNTTSSNWRQQMDASLLAACTNAKNAGVIVFTVGFSIPSDPIDTEGLKLLQKCATDVSKAFVGTTGDELLSAFQQIGVGLSNLRIKS